MYTTIYRINKRVNLPFRVVVPCSLSW